MRRDDVHQTVEMLQVEVEKLDAVDPVVQEKLTSLVRDIEQHLDQPDAGASPGDHIPNLIEQFEVEHPRITEILNRMMMALSDVGI